MSALNEYYAALERLKANKPTVLPKGSAINNDTVGDWRQDVNEAQLRRAVMLHWCRQLSWLHRQAGQNCTFACTAN